MCYFFLQQSAEAPGWSHVGDFLLHARLEDIPTHNNKLIIIAFIMLAFIMLFSIVDEMHIGSIAFK